MRAPLYKKTGDLPDKARQILAFLRGFFQEHDRPPTIREILSGCGLSSTSVVEYNLRILEKLGYVRRSPEISRGIDLVERPRRGVMVPLLGQIAAGEPIPVPTPDAWSNPPAEMLELPQDLTGGKEGVYALKVKGTSMVDALIADGDIVLMQPANTAQDGDMVAVWLKAEKEVTLKKLYRERGRIRLQPANSQMKPIYTRPGNVEIQGKVIGVLRQLG